MKKALKITVKLLVFFPVALITIFIAFEFLGAVVNSAATAIQTSGMKKDVEKLLQDSVILDSYSETGNTSGTGNHVDMLSVIVFKSNEKTDQITQKLHGKYKHDEWCCWVEDLDTAKSQYSFVDKLNLPEESNDCYLFYLNKSAPFSDNILGH